jgi:uncharacterized protein YigE (DUF2233 family)
MLPSPAFRQSLAAVICAVLCAAVAPSSGGAAEPCRSERFEDALYTVCTFDVRDADLRIFWGDASGKPYSSFSALAEDLAGQGLTLQFAMNGGMYAEDLRPVGLYVENGEEVRSANTNDGPGNFHMKPNGVFYVGDGEAGVLETERFLRARTEARFATQSGPMLVIDGAIHPRFIPGSDSLKRRNGVGVSSETMVHFVISESQVSFDAFARFFRDRLGCDNALFLDGTISGLYAPGLNRNDSWFDYGPIIGAVTR